MSDANESPLRVTVFDYGAGNLHSLVKAMERPGVTVRIEPEATRLLEDTDALVLPGVGAFAQASASLCFLSALNAVAHHCGGDQEISPSRATSERRTL